MNQPNPRHLEYPRLRPVEAFAVEHEGERLYAVRDVTHLSDQVVAISLRGLAVLERFDGASSIDDVALALQVDVNLLRPVVAQLDAALLLHGPTFDNHMLALVRRFDALEALPVRATRDVTNARINTSISAVERTAPGSARVSGLVVPHLDFNRGHLNYATGYCAARNTPEFDRIVVLGTNHFGRSTGVVMLEKSCETNLGRACCDFALAERLRDDLGEALVEHRLDHLREHSVELQLPWIRRLWPETPVLGFLVHDPLVASGASYDGRGVALTTFVDALAEALREANGRTLIIASADLSHVGGEFGDDEPNSPARLAEIATHDRKHLAMLERGEVDQFLESMQACRNATRWCTLGGMTALWRLLPHARPKLLRYDQAIDHPSQGACCVTSAAMILENPDDDEDRRS